MHVTKFSKIILSFSVLAFFSFGFLGLGHTNMVMGSDGEMPAGNCFMPGMTEVICEMNPLEHIAAWQSMFTTLPSQSDVLLLLASLLTLALCTLFLRYRSTALPRVIPVLHQRIFLYFKQRVPIIDQLQEAFSNGILHPRLYN